MHPNSMSQHDNTGAYFTPPRNSSSQSLLEKRRKRLFTLGILEIVLGLSCCILMIALTVLRRQDYKFLIGQPTIFEVIGFLTTGVMWVCAIMGVMSQYKPSRCIFIGNLVMNIINSILMFFLALISTVAAIASQLVPDSFICYVLLAFVCSWGLISAIVDSIYSCAVLSCCCCCRSTVQYPGQVLYTSPQVQQPAMIPAQTQNGQIVFYQPPVYHSGSSQSSSAQVPMHYVPLLNPNQPVISPVPSTYFHSE